MFGRLLSITPPDPYLNIDVGSNKLSNSDITDASNIVLTDPSTNRSVQLKNYTLEDSALESIPISVVSSERVSHTELKAGVYRIDTLLPGTAHYDPSTQSYAFIAYQINLGTNPDLWGKTISFYLSTPDGKTFNNTGFVQINDEINTIPWGESNPQFLKEGLNIYKIPPFINKSKYQGIGTLKIYFRLPQTFYDTDEDGYFIQTNLTGCYFVVFPYLNDNKTGFGTYVSPKFNEWEDDSHSTNVTRVSDTEIIIDQNLPQCWYFYYHMHPYYRDSSIVVFNPIFYEFIVSGQCLLQYDLHYATAEDNNILLLTLQAQNNLSGTKLTSIQYGYVYKGDLSAWTDSFIVYFFDTVGLTVTMLPYGYDRFYTGKSFGVSNVYGSIKESDGSNLQIVPGTLITKFKFQATTTNYLYQYSQATEIPDRISYTGFIIDGNTGNSQPAFQSALVPSEGVSYVDGVINNSILDQDLNNKETIGALVLYKDGSVDTSKESLLFSHYSGDQILSGFIGALYNLIMFDEDVRLTPWQVQYITQKYIK